MATSAIVDRNINTYIPSVEEETQSKFNFDIQFEYSILHLMLKDESFCSKCSLYLKRFYFQHKYLSWFYDTISKYYKKYSKCPDSLVIFNEIKRILPEKQDDYLAVLKNILDVSIKSDKYIKSELTDFVKENEFEILQAKIRKIWNEDKDRKGAIKYNFAQTERIKLINFSEENEIKGKDLIKILENIKEKNKEKIPLGIPLIDTALLGGIPKESVCTVLAGWNVGKSFFLINCAYFAARASKRALFISLEDREDVVVSRFVSRICTLPYERIVKKEFREDDSESLNKAIDYLDNYICIKQMKGTGVTVEDICVYVKEKMKIWPFDIVVIDHGQAITLKKKYSELRHNYAEIWRTLDQLAGELKIAILTAAQLNRAGAIESKNKHKIVRSDSVGECIQIAQISETILTLNPTKEGDLVVCLDKQRDGRTSILVKCYNNRDLAITHDVSLGQEEYSYKKVDEAIVNEF